VTGPCPLIAGAGAGGEALAAYVRSEVAAPVEEGAAAGPGKPRVEIVREIRQLIETKK